MKHSHSLNLVLFGFFLAIFITELAALSCPCQQQIPKCTTAPPTDCKGGLVPDGCGCCQVCAKVIGEVCGGPFFQFCDEGLICEQTPDVEITQAPGICVAGKPKKGGETCGPRQSGQCRRGLYCDQLSPGNVGICKKKKPASYHK